METLGTSNIGTNANETNKQNSSEMLVENKRIPNTPFTKRWEKDKGWSWGFASYQISDWYKTEKEVDNDYKTITYDKILAIIAVVAQDTVNMNKNK